jgi:Ca2+-binding EF-hand superfamily protein
MADYVKLAEKFFKKYDTNDSNYIEQSELKKLLTDVSKEIGISPPEDVEIKELLQDYDLNKDNKISKDEFVKFFNVILEMKKDNK